MNENEIKQKKAIQLITLSTCFFCNKVKKMLDEAGFKFDSADIDMLPENDREKLMIEIRKHNPRESFPIVIIGDLAIIGFQEERIKKELGIS